MSTHYQIFFVIYKRKSFVLHIRMMHLDQTMDNSLTRNESCSISAINSIFGLSIVIQYFQHTFPWNSRNSIMNGSSKCQRLLVKSFPSVKQRLLCAVLTAQHFEGTKVQPPRDLKKNFWQVLENCKFSLFYTPTILPPGPHIMFLPVSSHFFRPLLFIF